jgi:hypothetical protein
VYTPPVVRPSLKIKKSIYIGAPRVGWYAGVKARVRPAPITGVWYVKPKAPRARVLFGAKASGRFRTTFAVVAPRPRAQAGIKFRGGVGIGVRDHRATAVDVDAAHGARVKAGVKAGIKVKAGAKVGVDAPAVEVRDKVDARVKAGKARVELGGRGRGDAALDVRAKAGVKVKAPKVEPPKVKVKAKGEVKGGVKIGN